MLHSTIGLSSLLRGAATHADVEAMENGAIQSDIETLSYPARVRRFVEIGCRSKIEPNAARLLRERRIGGFTQRQLAAFARHGCLGSASLAELATDESRTIAHIALSVLYDWGTTTSCSG